MIFYTVYKIIVYVVMGLSLTGNVFRVIEREQGLIHAVVPFFSPMQFRSPLAIREWQFNPLEGDLIYFMLINPLDHWIGSNWRSDQHYRSLPRFDQQLDRGYSIPLTEWRGSECWSDHRSELKVHRKLKSLWKTKVKVKKHKNTPRSDWQLDWGVNKWASLDIWASIDRVPLWQIGDQVEGFDCVDQIWSPWSDCWLLFPTSEPSGSPSFSSLTPYRSSKSLFH